MNPGSAATVHTMRPQILERRARLRAAADSLPADYVSELLTEIDEVLKKIDSGTYGLCDTCGDPIEAESLERDPLVRFCIDHLSEEERRAFQEDIDLAAQIQLKLLPPKDVPLENWEVRYRYEPAGAVGGDYCESVPLDHGKCFFFAVGDVAGKGVAASLLMTHLSAIFRSLLSMDLPVADVVARANRLFCDSTAAAHYATLACGRATADGIEVCNAGHCPPLLLRHNGTQKIDSTGLPLGLFSGVPYTARTLNLDQGDVLILYSDGVTEACDANGDEYGEDRLMRIAQSGAARSADAMADAIVRDVKMFRGPAPPADDMTVLVVRRLR